MKKTILITGATGYIGSRLVLTLVRDYNVIIVARKNSDLSALDPVLHEIKIIVHDGTIENLIAQIKAYQPSMVYHLASLFIAQHTVSDVDRIIESNILFSSQLLEACVQCGCRYFINTGTSWQNYDNTKGRSANLYAASKEAFEKILSYYCDVYELRSLTLSLFDTYGPGDTRKKLIPMLLNHAQSGTVLDMSPGRQLIDLVFIDDVISAFRLAGEAIQEETYESGKTFVVSSYKRVSLIKLVEYCTKCFGGNLTVNFGTRPYRDREVMVPWKKGKRLPGWKPAVGIVEGLTITAEAVKTIPRQK